jgi:hypothetical protein
VIAQVHIGERLSAWASVSKLTALNYPNVHQLMDGWKDGGWMDGWMDRWMDGWMSG